MTWLQAGAVSRLRSTPGAVLAAGVALLGAWTVVPAGPPRAVLMLLLNTLAVAAILVGVRRRSPPARRAWLVLAAAQACSVVAFACWFLVPMITGWVLPVPSPVDGLFVAVYAGSCTALALLVRGEGLGRDRETFLDVLMVGVSLGALSWVFLMQPYARSTELSLSVKVLAVSYPALDLLLVMLALRLTFTGSRVSGAKLLLLAWASLRLVGDTAFWLLSLRGAWTVDSPVILLGMAGFACLAGVAWHPGMASLGSPAPTGPRGRGPVRRVVVVGSVLGLPALLTVRLVRGEVADLAPIAAASVVVCMLALAQGHVGRRTGTMRADQVALARLVAGFVALALLPLGLLAESSIRLSERAVESDARARVRTVSTVSAELVKKQMEGVGQLVAAYAERRLLVESMGDGTPESIDEAAVEGHLSQLEAAHAGIAAVYVTDPDGRVRGLATSQPGLGGTVPDSREWFEGARPTVGPYVSEAHHTQAGGSNRVVTVSTAMRRQRIAQSVGTLAAVYDLRALQDFSDELAEVQGVSLQITDQRGSVVAAAGAAGNDQFDTANGAGVASALRGQESMGAGTGSDGEEVLSAYAPVAGIGWTVAARLPAATAYASLTPLRSTVLAITVLLGQVLLGGLVLMARAQRQRHEAERNLLEREESTRGILEAAADAFVATDATGVVTSWSAQSELLFGWTSEQACGAQLAELIVPPALRRRHDDAVLHIAQTGTGAMVDRRTERQAVHRDGHEFPVELVIWKSVAGRTVSFNAFIHDISARKEHEAQLAAARDEAVEASRAKTEFLAVMSHELRTPMNGVVGMTSLLLDTALSPHQRDYAETVRSSAESLLDLLNGVLDLSKADADRIELEVLDFDLHRVVGDVVRLLEPGARQNGVALVAAIDDAVPHALRGDAARLRQVLLNLVGNALKFTSVGSVGVRVLMAAPTVRGQVGLRFEITDTGIGIAADTRDGLFEAFAQADVSTTRRYGGTGLGLAISKRLVGLFGGEIGVDSAVGVGSTFWFTAAFAPAAPMAAEAEPETAPEVRPAPTGKRGLVLVVDDNPVNRKIAVRMLETLGHRTDVAVSGVEATAACARVAYDLVLMDCRMPEMDGYDATEIIRAAEGTTRRTPIVAMTASVMVADRQRCVDVGMDDFLSKPVRLADLRDTLERWMADQQQAGPGLQQPEPGPGLQQPEPGPPVLDEALLAGLFALGPDFVAQLVPVFAAAVPERLGDLRAAIRDGDAAGLATAAHVLVGSAANMGGLRVAAACARLEDAGRSGRLDGAEADLLVVEAEVPVMLAALGVHIERARVPA